MGRAGRKRKFGPREQNGRLKRILAAHRDRDIAEMVTVLSQPHRRGDTEQKLESPLGRLVLRNKLGSELYDAGVEYGGLVRHFHAAKGVPSIISEGSGSGAGVSPEKAKKLGDELERIEPPLKKLSYTGYSAVRMLCVHEREIPPSSEYWAVEVLFLLAQLLKKLGSRP
jgi:hypothetical protein